MARARPDRLPLVWLGEAIATPPFSEAGRIEAGTLLRLVQEGEPVGMPQSRPMPSIGPRCHELRVRDEGHNWRLVYRIDDDAVLLLHVFVKTTQKTPAAAVALCQRRAALYDAAREAGT